MAVIGAKEQARGRSAKVTIKGRRDYTRSWVVWTDDPATTELDVRDYATIPNAGDAYPNDPGALVVDVDAKQRSNSRIVWDVGVAYSSETDQQQQSENPLERPPVVSRSFSTFSRPANKDIDGNPIVNKANLPFDPLPEIDDARFVVTVQRNEAAFPTALALQYVNAVNSDPFSGAAAGQVKCQGITGNDQEENGQFFVSVVYEFHYRYEGFRLSLLNQGMAEINAAGDEHDNPRSKQGRVFSEPVLLDEAGRKLPPAGTPVYIEFKVYRELPFAALGLPI